MAKIEKASKEVVYWLGEIAAAKKREDEYRKDGKRVVEIYSGERCDETPFNILFSNTETVLPALFSQTPRPVVDRRFKDEDPLGKAAAKAGQRMLEYLCDTNVEGYETFEQSMTSATLDALLPGRGVTTIKYDAEVIEPEEGSDAAPMVEWEQVCTDSRSWDRIYLGYAKKWSKVPWIAYEEYLDEAECKRLFGEEIAGKINYSSSETEDDEDKGSGTGGRDDVDQGDQKTAQVFQIWDRSGGKKVRYISSDYPDGYLKVEDDPLELTGFFNCPKPLQFIEKSNDMLPVAMYKLYENQAKELNRISSRIRKMVEALKVRGAYDGSLGDELEKLLKEDDNALIPTDKGGSLAAEGGLERAIWMLPIDKIVVVLQQLIVAREQCKRVIYEITGIADILRGSSMASETLGAQKIKEAWGTLRLKRLQKSVQRYARDTLRIMLEIAANKLSEKTWARATGLPFATSEQKEQAQQLIMASQMSGVQPDPQALQVLQSPGWSEVLALLRDDVQRAYRIDIETNSTIDTEATEDQQNISQVMQAIAQFMHGIGPMVEKGVMPFEVAQNMLLTIVRRFRFGVEVEDSLKNMKPPKPPDDGKAGEMQKVQAEMQAAMAELQQNAQLAQMTQQAEGQLAQAKLQGEMQVQAAQMQADKEIAVSKLQAQMETDAAKLQSQRSIEQMKAKITQETELRKAMIVKETAIEVARIQAGAAMGTAMQKGAMDMAKCEMEMAHEAKEQAEKVEHE